MSPITLFDCTPIASSPTIVPASTGSSLAYSKFRPLRGSRIKSIPPPIDMLYPWSRSSLPITAPYRNPIFGSQLDAIPITLGSSVAYRLLTAAIRTPTAESASFTSGSPSRGIPCTNLAPPLSPGGTYAPGRSGPHPIPCTSWIFSSSVISLIIMSARVSGSSAAFIHGCFAAATAVCATPTFAAPTLSNTHPAITQLFATTDPILIHLPFQRCVLALHHRSGRKSFLHATHSNLQILIKTV